MYTLFPFQEEAVNAVFNFFRREKGNPLIVSPTGSGKSVIIAVFCQRVINKWPNQKLLIVSDDQEIVEQDYKAIKKQLPYSEIGLYSAGLKSRIIENITVAAIQSIYKRPDLFKGFNLGLVDEAHKVPYKRKGRYHVFFKALNIFWVGFTATPFRMECGLLTSGDNPFFTETVYEVFMEELVKEGRLCSLTSKRKPKVFMDTKGVKKVAGEFNLNSLSLKFDRPAITDLILDNLVNYYPERKKMLVYGIDIQHVNHITAGLNQRGMAAKALHTETASKRKQIIQNFKNDEFPALVSVAMLTTGVNIPDVDTIVLMRPTNSLSLHIQIIGRGTRTAEGKKDCLVLDYANNLHRNGPVNNPVIRDKTPGKREGQAIMKDCPECFEILHIAVRKCPDCGFKFEFQHHLAPNAQLVNSLDLNVRSWHDVKEIKYMEQLTKKGSIPMLTVRYQCGLRFFKEYVLLEHMNHICQNRAASWWKKRWPKNLPLKIPLTVNEALKHIGLLKTPKQIYVDSSSKFPNIRKYRFL